MKKIVCTILAAVMLLALLASCGQQNGTGKKTFKIGICNYVDDASLNQIVDSIKKQLATYEDVTFDIKYDNCNADASVMTQIISNFIAEKVDLMVGVATPVAMQMQNATEDNKIPVVFAAVSDPLGAGLVDSLENPGKNITGTSDYLDTAAVLKLIEATVPGITKVGLLYDVGQDSSTKPIADAKAYLSGKGIEVIERTGTTAEEVTIAARALVTDGVQAVFTPTDNTIMKSELAIYEIFRDAKIPHFTGADSFALNGAFLGYGVDYANLGKETGAMIADILMNSKDPGKVAVKTFDNGTATVNTEICEAIGLDFEALKTVYAPLCTKVQSIVTAEKFEGVD
ncbi:MAG: ABC transporter substrate-binding protein [Clostridia bacterium]|nr:ABC transporter substrate-binding protein [Clostridia bacterium]